ncbi:transposase domain-containing protein [Parashewanella curva]|uniref:Transposase domain-containing protein n=1 Tax=Parashewanella curva TaxID=2338552 RepID=A0A3L8PRC0_9GAMM|nr:transposase domain-containing protein [Parashewanella curva]
MLYSIVETCKVNGVNPSQYLTYLFEQLAHAPSDLEPLMPWNFDKD